MRWASFFAACVVLTGCGTGVPHKVAPAEAKSMLGPISKWKLDPALNAEALQKMRDRAYNFCLTKRPSDKDCFNEQDWSLFEFANAYASFREFRSGANSSFPFARGYSLIPSAFERPRRYCMSVYVDAGSQDARSLGPCMSAATGGDYFGIAPVP
jgi:hypothetical protein